jgi:hypothetical protein
MLYDFCLGFVLTKCAWTQISLSLSFPRENLFMHMFSSIAICLRLSQVNVVASC